MTGTRAPLKIVTTHRATLSGKAGCVLPADSLTPPKPKLLDQLLEALRSRHYSSRTEQTYYHWVKRHILFHNTRLPIGDGSGFFLRRTVGRTCGPVNRVGIM